MPWRSRRWPSSCRAAAGSTWCGWIRRRRRKSSLGPAAYAEYERVFGSRLVGRWPQHLVLDGLDTIELLLDTGNLTIHPRCVRLKDAFRNYCRQRRGGEWIDFPADGHPEEDMMDALRGGIRDAMPEGCRVEPGLPRIHASRLQ